MKHLKILGLAAVAAMAMMAFAGPASATTLTNEGVKMGTGQSLEASVTKSALLQTGGGTTIATCTEGVVAGKITNPGGSVEDEGGKITDVPVSGSIEKLTFEKCNTTVDVLANGTLSVHHIAGGNNGTVTSNGARVTINFLGVSCVFETKNTDVGVATEGKPSKFDISGNIPGISGFPCPSTGIWSGEYTVTNPSGTLAVDAL